MMVHRVRLDVDVRGALGKGFGDHAVDNLDDDAVGFGGPVLPIFARCAAFVQIEKALDQRDDFFRRSFAIVDVLCFQQVFNHVPLDDILRLVQ
jgi:hypothetical protein